MGAQSPPRPTLTPTPHPYPCPRCSYDWTLTCPNTPAGCTLPANNTAYRFTDENGMYMSRCSGCIGNYGGTEVAVLVNTASPGPSTAFTIQYVSTSPPRAAIRANNGFYLTFCSNCLSNAAPPLNYNEQVTFTPGFDNPESIWEIEQQPDCRLRLRNVGSGTYAMRCNACGGGVPDQVSGGHLVSSGACGCNVGSPS